MNNLKGINKIMFVVILAFSFFQTRAQDFPNPALVGYWEAWDFNNRYVALEDVDDRYNVICLAFASYKGGKDYDIEFNPPSNYTDATFKTAIQNLQAEGKKVLISIGGQTTPHILDSLYEKEVFVSSVNTMVDYWGFDGIDIDLEGSSVHYSDVNVQNPGDTTQKLFIQAVREILDNHLSANGKRLFLTMAPETAYVQGALSPWGSAGYKGSYLPIIETFKDDIDMLNVQLYNSGSMYGLDGVSGGTFFQGNGDFVLAMTEAVILGFTGEHNIGTFSGLPASKVGVALPGCNSSDAVPHDELKSVMKYLTGDGPQIGDYTLKTEGGYPALRGMMTWSINSDNACSPSYGYASTYDFLFGNEPAITMSTPENIYEGNEDGRIIRVELLRSYYEENLDTNNWKLINLPEGVSLDSLDRVSDSVVNLVLKGNTIDVNASYPWAITDVGLIIQNAELEVKTLDSVYALNGLIFNKYPREIPGIVQGESYENFFGTKRKQTVGTYWQGDWSEYEINVLEDGDYIIDFRLGTSTGNRTINIKIDGVTQTNMNYASSTGYQVYENYKAQLNLTAGQHTLRITSTLKWFNLDYMSIEKGVLSDVELNESKPQVNVFPNPFSSIIYLSTKCAYKIYSIDGQLLKSGYNQKAGGSIDLSTLQVGLFILESTTESGQKTIQRIVKN